MLFVLEDGAFLGKGDDKGRVARDGIYIAMLGSWFEDNVNVKLLHLHDPSGM
jgi:hypothetical protein